ncbi:MAG: Gfo/Idh/MocA family oxidoreductase [Propionibacteriaceae bacterium]
MLGAGMITTVSYGFLPGLQKIADRVQVVAIASRTRALAEQVARDYAIPAVYATLAEMLADAELEAVVNATPGPVHYETSMEILAAGKHLVTDKPLAATVAEADEICALAAAKGLLVVCAPFDLLSREWAEARRLVAAGAVGQVAFARVQSSHAGPAAMAWPSDPTWFYQQGAGSLVDIGVYGIDRITGILGPAQRVTAMSGQVAAVRDVRGGPFDGRQIAASEHDNTLLLLDFGDSTFATVDATYNVVASRSAPLEIFGLAGTLVVRRPDAVVSPGQLALELFRLDAGPGLSGWVTPHGTSFEAPRDRTVDLARASLVEHLLDCLEQGSQPVTSGERARHVLEIMVAARTSAQEGHVVELATTFTP